MNTGTRLFLSAAFVGAALSAQAFRDPFWPIGYEPPKPVENKPPPVKVDKQPVPPKPPPVKPITEAEWGEARKSFVIRGFTQVLRPDTGEKRTQVMIGRQIFSPGDTLCVTNGDACFSWQIESLANRNMVLKPLRAARLKAGQPHFTNQ